MFDNKKRQRRHKEKEVNLWIKCVKKEKKRLKSGIEIMTIGGDETV